ncbi:J domain-containing protein [Microbulbifer agarilyticus]|uniref:Molecular chaperone DnaJ n=1 Tax=Microbulbifer agarilyticus TaxID=260552 RepID=A0A1Q2M4Z1_9GAMM|nr:molecular chaperone DnaJ [Microbulbifer agarilyticus]AQQ67805.1 molecular chaperone DnaJ [Microbulbifer agarilyticus]MCA0891975.1 molecular chaperone DnaJ [Microbulbifer agarilyticus]
MGRIILLIAVAIFAWLAVQKFKYSPPEQRRKLVIQWVLIALALGAVLLAVTGRLHWVGAAVAIVLPILNRLWRTFGRHLPWIAPLIAKHAQARAQKQQEKSQRARSEETGEGQAHGKPESEPQLTLAEARKILSVPANASREEIIGAHRKLIQKFHPDRGGSDYLASRINAAKALLLKNLDGQ